MSVQTLPTLSNIPSTMSALAPPSMRETWWNGKAYSENSLWQFELANEILLTLPFKGIEKVLDIGCGDVR